MTVHLKTNIDIWQMLLSEDCAKLRQQTLDRPKPSVRDLKHWRQRWPEQLVHAALELAKARQRARRKFPDHTDIVADSQGFEQATSALVGDHKAKRFRKLNCSTVVDLCCGIGGDAMSLVRVCKDLQAVDIDKLRAWMTAQNAGCETQTQDVLELDLRNQVFHLDPARRDESARRRTRLHRFADYRPGPDFIKKLLGRCHTGAIKLGPGVTLEELPEPQDAEIELISERGTLVQAVLWTGELAERPGLRTATCLPRGESFSATPQPIETGEAKRFLLAVDPAIERADLLGAFGAELGLKALHPQLGLLTSENRIDHPLLRCFDLQCDMPFRLGRVKAWLAAHDGGLVEIKTRGGAINPDQAQQDLRGKGQTHYTIFVLRFDQKRRALICTRPPRGPAPAT